MKKSLSKIVFIGAIVALFTVSGFSQDRRTNRPISGSPYVISASAGGINYVQGRVSIRRATSSTDYLAKGDTVKVGDRVTTGEFSKAEILLNPGSYVRLGANSEFEFITTSLEDLKLRLVKGSAIFEVYAGGDFMVTVHTPESRFYLMRSGVYRIDVNADGTSRIEVRKGRAQVGTQFAQKIKKGKAADVNGNQISISKFKRKNRDELELWSRNRAKRLAKANARLSRKTSLRNSLWSGYRANRWNTYNSFGLWTYSSALGGYCFLPFGNRWRSPYGFGLGRDIYHFRLPKRIYYSAPTVGAGSTLGKTLPTGTPRRRTTSVISRQGATRGVGNTGRTRTGNIGSSSRSVRPAPRRDVIPRRPSQSSGRGRVREKVKPGDIDQ